MKKYFQGHFAGDLCVFSELSRSLGNAVINDKERVYLQKLLQIFFIGQLVGLPTLDSILKKFNIGNYHHTKYKNLCNSLSVNVIRKMFEHVFELHIQEVLGNMSAKDGSCWSKDLVTVILDDSVFRQWLQNQKATASFEEYYGKFFSGQYGVAVYGFKVVCLGVCIDGVQYPLYFDFVKKPKQKTEKSVAKTEGKKAKTEEKKAKTEEKKVKTEEKKAKTEEKKVKTVPKKVKTEEELPDSIRVAIKLVSRFGDFRKRLANEGLKLPKLHFSCDNGYSYAELSTACEANDLIFISVPKKTHIFEIAEQRIKLSEWIQKDFISAEKIHQEQEKNLPKDQKTAFTFRVKANYCTQGNKQVVLLAFRLNNSNKISVIYSTDKHIFAKTLRRHWFQRTYIEQFFKLLKHVLHIQEARVQHKDGFEIKLLRFAFVAWHAQKLVRFLRRNCKAFRTKGFITIQRILNSDNSFLDLLHSFL